MSKDEEIRNKHQKEIIDLWYAQPKELSKTEFRNFIGKIEHTDGKVKKITSSKMSQILGSRGHGNTAASDKFLSLVYQKLVEYIKYNKQQNIQQAYTEEISKKKNLGLRGQSAVDDFLNNAFHNRSSNRIRIRAVGTKLKSILTWLESKLELEEYEDLIISAEFLLVFNDPDPTSINYLLREKLEKNKAAKAKIKATVKSEWKKYYKKFKKLNKNKREEESIIGSISARILKIPLTHFILIIEDKMMVSPYLAIKGNQTFYDIYDRKKDKVRFKQFKEYFDTIYEGRNGSSKNEEHTFSKPFSLKNKLLFVIGPGGVGKSPLAKTLHEDCVSLDPIRYRKDGPRDKNDSFYVSETEYLDKKNQLTESNGQDDLIENEHTGSVFYKNGNALVFKTKESDQILYIPMEVIDEQLYKLEVHSSEISFLLDKVGIDKMLIADIFFVFLNPSSFPISNPKCLEDMKQLTRLNCEKRSENPNGDVTSINYRVNAVEEDLVIWNELMNRYPSKFFEFTEWEYPEYEYKNRNHNEITKEVYELVADKAPDLIDFFQP